MNFEEMQVIWDSQKERTMYAMDTSALHELVKSRSRKQGTKVSVDELAMTLICLGVAAMLAAEPFFEGEDPHQYIGAVLFVGVAVFTLLGRRRRLRRELQFEATLVGDLNRAINRVDAQIRRSETFMLWFMVPALITVVVSFFQKHATKSLGDWLLVGLAFPLAYVVVRAGLRCGLLPAKRELEALKQKLSS